MTPGYIDNAEVTKSSLEGLLSVFNFSFYLFSLYFGRKPFFALYIFFWMLLLMDVKISVHACEKN